MEEEKGPCIYCHTSGGLILFGIGLYNYKMSYRKQDIFQKPIHAPLFMRSVGGVLLLGSIWYAAQPFLPKAYRHF